MSRKRYETYVQAGDWRVRETLKEWLLNQTGPRGLGWSFMWQQNGTYKVTLFSAEDMVAFKLAFDTEETFRC